MPYLFEQEINAGLKQRPTNADVLQLRDLCQETTSRLLSTHSTDLPEYEADTDVPSDWADSDASGSESSSETDSDSDADIVLSEAELVENMGARFRRDRKYPNLAHASDKIYAGMDTWHLVSDNAVTIRDKVHRHLPEANALGLDTQSPEVIGKMFLLAAHIFRVIDGYNSSITEIRR